MTHRLVVHIVLAPGPPGLADAAREVAEGLGETMTVKVHDVAMAPRLSTMWLDLVVVGVPAPASFVVSRRLSGTATLRPWLDRLGSSPHSEHVATFETRRRYSLLPPGRTARAARRALHDHGYTRPAGIRSFVLDRRTGQLVPGERERARAWGRDLAGDLAARNEGHSAVPYARATASRSG